MRYQRAPFGVAGLFPALFFLTGAAFAFAADSIAFRATVFSPRRSASDAAIHSGA